MGDNKGKGKVPVIKDAIGAMEAMMSPDVVEKVNKDVKRTLDRIARARDMEKLRAFVSDAAEWSTAYPVATFREPTAEELAAVCASLGVRIDCIAAMILRDYTSQWSARAKALLEEVKP